MIITARMPASRQVATASFTPGARRIDHPDQAEEGELALDVSLGVRSSPGAMQLERGAAMREHAERSRRSSVGLGQDLLRDPRR